MPKLGLIGGTGPESTVAYYRQVTTGFQSRSADGSLPPLVIDSLSAFQVFEFLRLDDLRGLCDYLAEGGANLVAAGATVGALTGITPHIVVDELSARCSIPLVSAITTTRDELLAGQGGRALLLGTEFTMTRGFVTEPLHAAGLEVVVPDAPTIHRVQHLIETELEHGVVREETRAEFAELVSRSAERDGTSRVILGCTELPMVLDDETSPIPTLDVAAVHARRLVDHLLTGSPERNTPGSRSRTR